MTLKNDVIIINGQGYTGKDTFVKAIDSYIKTNYPEFKVVNYSSIDTIRNIASIAFGYDVNDKSTKSRKFLSDFKALVNSYNQFTINETLQKIYNKSENEILFIHIREPHEIDLICHRANQRVMKLLLMGEQTFFFGNPSDDQVFDCEYDVTFRNIKNETIPSDIAEIFINDYLIDK